MKIRAVGAELFHAEAGRQTVGLIDLKKLILVLGNFADAPKTVN
jgi:Fe-S-cluster formation regulator IscX/YfhJ